MRQFLTQLTVLFAAVTMPAIAWGHPGHAAPQGHGLASGLWHPLTGWDHLLALIAVGLLAVRIGGRGLWAVPAAFLGSCAIGALAAVTGISLPAVEMMIFASILVPAALIARRTGATLMAATIVAALFGAFHGLAHLQEMSPADSVAMYALGLMTCSSALLAASVSAGRWAIGSATKKEKAIAIRHWRLASAALSLTALLLLVSQ